MDLMDICAFSNHIEATNQIQEENQKLLHEVSSSYHINELPEKEMIAILSYIPHVELCKTISQVCKQWRLMAYNSALWTNVSLRPEYCHFYCSMEAVLALVTVRLGSQLRSLELPCDLITVPILHELANKCPNVRNITLDFSKATQLYDFTDLTMFPSNLRSLTICLSEVVFLEGFMRRVYSCLSSLKILHLIGTFDSASEDEEVFEVVNISKIRAHTPNLTTINFFGVTFVDDSHVEMLATNCIHLEVVALNYCLRVNGSSFKLLTTRCKKLRTLLLRHTSLTNENVQSVDWSKCRHLCELDICCTDLSENCLMDFLVKLPPLSFLAVAHCDFFSDKILTALLANKKLVELKSLDVSKTYNLGEATIMNLLKIYGEQLHGLMLDGKPKLSETFWLAAIPLIPNIRILTLGTAYGWFLGNLSRVHLDQIINYIALNCPRLERLEIQWEPDTIRYSDKSSKFIDLLRIRCTHLRTVTLADGGYFEMFRSNFDRAGKANVVRPTQRYQTSVLPQLNNFNDLLFN